uniref:Putative carbohydrate kinase n=1 Tax=viral metagenome TaxID=1070528 RepID=A0A6M3J8N3_9ZZZZ
MIKIFGVSILEDYDILPKLSEEVYKYLLSEIPKYDLVIVNDFGHGFINRDIIETFSQARFLAVNTQTNTDNAGFNLITKYPRADYVCLDEPETRLACQDKYGKIENLILLLSKNVKCNKIAVTHGQYPTIMYDGKFYEIPTLSNGLKDTTGAGDAFFAITAPCVATGLPMDVVGFIGNAVGALKVKIVCNRSSVEPEALYKFITELKENENGLRVGHAQIDASPPESHRLAGW